MGFLELSSPCSVGRLGRGFGGGMKDGGAVCIGAVPLGFVVLTGEVDWVLTLKFWNQLAEKELALGNLENFSTSQAIW